MPERFESFAEFYPYYLTEHSDRSCRRLHFIGTALVMLTLIVAVASDRYALLWLVPDVAFLHHMGITFLVLVAFMVVATLIRPATALPVIGTKRTGSTSRRPRLPSACLVNTTSSWLRLIGPSGITIRSIRS